jgi:hypothetical protein
LGKARGAESDGAVPGIVDANTLQWAMQKKLGDTIEYRDERGQPFNVRIVATLSGSMLQGNIVIAEQHLIEKYPGSGGYRFFLIDAPTDQTSAVSEELSRALQDRGMELTPASRRLAEFQAVENTYLSIFRRSVGWDFFSARLDWQSSWLATFSSAVASSACSRPSAFAHGSFARWFLRSIAG